MKRSLQVTTGMRIFGVFNYTFLALVALICVLPIVNVLAVSFSSSSAANANLVKFWPIEFTLQSYKAIFARKAIRGAFAISIERTILGVILNNILTIILAYPLSKSKDEFPRRNIYMWGLIFVMLFNGGLIPNYILVKNLGLLNSVWALVLPGAVPIFNVILMMNFFKQLPKEIEEAAFVDGASYWLCLLKIVIPLSMPVIATVTLFQFVGHWNDWFSGLIYMNNISKYPLQTLLQSAITSADLKNLEDVKAFIDVSDRTLKAAQIFVTTLPILVFYPFLQKYFAKGIVLGSVKG
jgi:putative aldouronate transport system permease protein